MTSVQLSEHLLEKFTPNVARGRDQDDAPGSKGEGAADHEPDPNRYEERRQRLSTNAAHDGFHEFRNALDRPVAKCRRNGQGG
jgi:hypothetical protein